jgi:SAM-dependent methyltransferase
MRPPVDIALIESVTPSVLASGHRILQTHKYGDDIAHVDYMLAQFRLPENACVLDAGCGIGEVARLMSVRRPDLRFVLMNLSMLQLSHCPVGDQYFHMLDDCHHSLLADGAVDSVMFSSALCQMDIPVALAEARRVVANGGVLLVNEMVRESGTPDEMEAAIAARVLPVDQLVRDIQTAGFAVDTIDYPDHDASHFIDMLVSNGIGHLLDGIKPVVIRAIAVNHKE